MTRDQFIPSFLLVTALALPLAACGGTEGETETPGETPAVTPTAEPTPTATATPIPPTPTPDFDKWQAMTKFNVAAENEGLDYDNDNNPDNGLWAAFETIQDSLLDSINETIDSLTDNPGEVDECEETDICVFTPQQATAAKAAAKTAIEQTVSVDTINDALDAAYAAGAQPQAINVVEEGSAYGLYYHSGAAEGSGWVSEEQIGYQPGDLDKTGNSDSEFGAGSFRFETSFGGGPGGGEETVIGFDIKDALTTFRWNNASISGALTGGGLEIVALTELVENILIALDEAGLLPDDFDQQAAVEAVETALIANSDITCPSTGNPC